ncbi:ABC transporter ATP-binding protein [Aggregatilinea lenta]|uniref:ABC transporter ATP-binding protein n=1 Tax=Aggregatilinea lenta TaxID=913108 RepID=UPI000E5BF64A|nr:ABC transporter ATP-binding protein [Aggregatilinea lenta]
MIGADKAQLERPMLETLSRLLGFVQPYRRRVIGVVLLMLVTSATVLISPSLVRQAINQGLVAGDSGALTRYSLLFLITVTVEAFGLRAQMWHMIWIGQHAIQQVRQALFYKYLDMDMSYYDHNRVGDMMARITEDSNSLQNFITWAVINFISNSMILVGIVVLLLIFDWSLALLTLVIVPLMAGLTLWWRRRATRQYRAVREAVGVVSATLQESLAGMRIIQAFVREYRQTSQFQAVATGELRASLRADMLSSVFLPGIDVISQLGIAMVIAVGGVRVLNGTLDPGTLVAFLLYLNLFFDPIRDLAMRLDQFQEAAAAGERILNVLDTQPEIVSHPGADPLPRLRGEVEMRDVSFTYVLPDQDQSGDEVAADAHADDEAPANILHDVSLSVAPGQMVALVGHTGAGKSTLVRLLGRFYEPQSGQILFDGHDITAATLDSLRAQMAWVPQDIGLFATTIRDNLRYGRLDATDEEIEAAARETGAHEFISQFPKGYDTDVEEGGSRLSAGQRQLISFTRALLADPVIIVLDEATSSVDTLTELQMQAALGRILEGRTSFVIAHRLSTIVRADQVVVMDHGRIIERGTHAELLAQHGHYYNLYMTQLRGGTEA